MLDLVGNQIAGFLTHRLISIVFYCVLLIAKEKLISQCFIKKAPTIPHIVARSVGDRLMTGYAFSFILFFKQGNKFIVINF